LRRAIRVSRAVQKILAELPRLKVPVDVYSIASRYATVTERDMDDDISGMLVPLAAYRKQQSWAIVVNKSHAMVRKRFTVAHELGHLFLHGYTAPHADRGFLIRLRSARASDGTVAEEIEANQFAAELLMPKEALITFR
jgi:Zn-dependent peptidase ImmA (M78 family)